MPKIYIYKISQDKNTGYDSYDSAIVLAENKLDAVLIHPGGKVKGEWWKMTADNEYCNWELDEWTTPGNVSTEFISEYTGVNNKAGDVLLASFNAG